MSGAGAVLARELEALAERLERGSGTTVLVSPDLQVHVDALADLTEDPRPLAAALVARAAQPGDVRADGPTVVELRGGRIADARPAGAGGTSEAVFTGALRIPAADVAPAAAAARRAADAARATDGSGSLVDHLLQVLIESGVPVLAVALDPWPWRRGPAGPDATSFDHTLADIDARQAHRIRVERARKADDGAWATLVSRPISRAVTPLALRLGLTPDQVTVASFLVGLTAAACLATGDRPALVAGGLLLQLSLVLDCVDGDVARYRRAFSARGAWLDASTDRVKEFACYGGLAWGSAADETWLPWLLAGAMLTLQTTRHTVDYTFTATRELREATARGAAVSAAAGAVQASQRGNRRPVVKWAKRLLHLGIGERWAVISVFALLGRPLLALVVLLVLGLVSLAYTSAGRTLRTLAWAPQEPSARERELVAAQTDPGPLVPQLPRRLASGRSRFLWVRPALLRLAEYAGVLALVHLAVPDRDEGVAAAGFALLLVVAPHHYDDLYRVLNGLRPPSRSAALLGLGAPGRLLVVALMALAGAEALQGGLAVLAALLGILFLVVEPLRVLREVSSRPPAVDPEVGGDGA